MKRCFRLGTALLVVMIAGLASVYWQIRNVDPEGACKGLGNFSMCADAWMNYNYGGLFKKLPTDQAMIGSFKKHRSDFDTIRDRVFSQQAYMLSLDNPEWKARHGVDYAHVMMPWTPTVYSSSDFVKPASFHEWSWQFDVASTKYIAGAEKYWPWVNRLKGYAYFPLPVPRIEQGRLLGPVLKDGRQFSWRVLDQLDRDWPEDWAHDECLLRRIEPQWFLFLCKDHIGG